MHECGANYEELLGVGVHGSLGSTHLPSDCQHCGSCNRVKLQFML